MPVVHEVVMPREVKTVWLALGPALNAGPAHCAGIKSRQSRLADFESRSSYFLKEYTYFNIKLG